MAPDPDDILDPRERWPEGDPIRIRQEWRRRSVTDRGSRGDEPELWYVYEFAGGEERATFSCPPARLLPLCYTPVRQGSAVVDNATAKAMERIAASIGAEL